MSIASYKIIVVHGWKQGKELIFSSSLFSFTIKDPIDLMPFSNEFMLFESFDLLSPGQNDGAEAGSAATKGSDHEDKTKKEKEKKKKRKRPSWPCGSLCAKLSASSFPISSLVMAQIRCNRSFFVINVIDFLLLHTLFCF